MAKERASVFDNDEDDLDLSGFSPKAAADQGPAPDQVRQIAEANKFRSREPSTQYITPPASQPAKRPPRRYRTGRTAQFNTRTTPETVDAFYAIADQQGWKVGETVEYALAALQREIAAKRGKK